MTKLTGLKLTIRRPGPIRTGIAKALLIAGHTLRSAGEGLYVDGFDFKVEEVDLDMPEQEAKEDGQAHI